MWLESCAPARALPAFVPGCFVPHPDPERTLAELTAFAPHVTVFLDAAALDPELLAGTPGATLGVLVAGADGAGAARGLDRVNRLASFRPALTGRAVGRSELWRAIPPPVSDLHFADVAPLHHEPQAISIGRSTPHREAMLTPAKHHHDLLQVIHGVSGEPLRELMSECDVGVYVGAEPGGDFGPQVGMHLASGQLLLADALLPEHGLERNIDYLQVESPDGLKWVLDRLRRFPEMHHRIRVRGRLKAEQYRASRLFARLAHDLLADLAAFGPGGV
jgi:hypothetical protein